MGSFWPNQEYFSADGLADTGLKGQSSGSVIQGAGG